MAVLCSQHVLPGLMTPHPSYIPQLGLTTALCMLMTPHPTSAFQSTLAAGEELVKPASGVASAVLTDSQPGLMTPHPTYAAQLNLNTLPSKSSQD